jgi:excinuclease ABC subunit A
MSKKSPGCIRLRGVRQNNLKNIDLDVPLRRLVVISGLSGSGKSSLAFETLFAEGQRRYIETFSPYARQFLDRMDKPQAKRIEGIPPAIAIEQRNSVKSTRSTVGTMTEITDYAKLFWGHLAKLHCRKCGKLVTQESPRQIWETMCASAGMPWPGPSRELIPSPRPTGRGLGRGDNLAESARITSHPIVETPLSGSLPAGGERGKESPTVGFMETVQLSDQETLITFDLELSAKFSLEESLALVGRQGYRRLLFKGEVLALDDVSERLKSAPPERLTVIQDRVSLKEANRRRFVEACEQAYHFGKGKLTVHLLANEGGMVESRRFSNRRHCAECDLEYREPSAALFSFNHPLGACPACRGFGRTIAIDYEAAIPDRSKTLGGGAVKPWQTKTGAECQEDMEKFAKRRKVPMDVPFRDLPKAQQDWVIDGDPGYGQDKDHKWPRAWYGVKGYFRWLESKAYKMHVRVLLSRYRKYETCPACGGARFQPETLLYRIGTTTLADFYRLPVDQALGFVEGLIERLAGVKTKEGISEGTLIRGSRELAPPDGGAYVLALQEVRSRLEFLVDSGLSYLSLDRVTRTLSGGETERVNLTGCLGSRLVNTLFVLDEPSVGLHPRDTARLVQIVQQLRDAGNTVVVVEHEASVMRAADQIIELGPGHGATGGEVVFQGTYAEILRAPKSLTGQYLSGKKQIEIPTRRPLPSRHSLILRHAIMHNLQDLTVEIPLERFVCVTGVSGSGKSTLVREVLLPALQGRLGEATREKDGKSENIPLPKEEQSEDEDTETRETDTESKSAIEGCDHLGQVVAVDQSSLGRTPRSNPAVYIGAFEEIRKLFAETETAGQRGLTASAFSFNSAQGQCERCRGAGFEKIEMQFLSDIFIRCPDCNGRRYRPHILEVKAAAAGHRWSIADLLDATVDEAVEFLGAFDDSRPAARAAASLKLLQEVGLGYLRLGQPINTLSGGESQRLKLVSHLASANDASDRRAKPTLFLFDEPTTGLHFEDIRILLKVFQRLVEAGHTVLVIEHNMEVVKTADWVIDLGPESGAGGGRLVVAGSPERVMAEPASHTGKALRMVLQDSEHQ